MADRSGGKAGSLLRIALIASAAGIVVQRVRDESARRAWVSARKNGRGQAIVTGASSGIGTTFALHLAKSGHPLVLVARREGRLEQLAKKLADQYGVPVEVLPADLTDRTELEDVATRISELDDLELLINNAGFGYSENFASSDIKRNVEMVELHDIASIRLIRAALPRMLANQHGGIINVSSLGGFFPLPGNASYSATKAYLTVMSQALSLELHGSGVRVQALCPGFTHTEFHDQFDNVRRETIPDFMWMPADTVVSDSLDALERGRVIHVPGVGYRMLAALGRSGIVPALAGLLR